MRLSARLLRWLSAGIFALIFIITMAVPVVADTGTYQILNYATTLEPQNTGDVKITYEQQWKVLSGDIPWITVGLPNSHFSIMDYSDAAAKVTADNSSGFSGVRVDLDKDYLPGQTFSVKFTILQGNLLERLTSENKWRINYTPGWYDRAAIDRLQITLISPVSYETYSSVSPMPASVNNNIITWEQSNLNPGEKFNVLVESLDGSFLTGTSSLSSQSSGPSGWVIVLIIAVVLLVIYGLIVLAVRKSRQTRDQAIKQRITAVEEQMGRDRKKKEEIEEGFEEYIEKKNIQPDAQGRYYDRSYGNYITPAIWAAVILTQQQRNDTPYSGNPHSSCACACVSCACACACACAGGGAAGCSRKTIHECSDCIETVKKPAA
jgi:hypothetical protein